MVLAGIRSRTRGNDLKTSLLAVILLMLTACGHHQPAPIEEHSASGIKRQISSDGNYYVRAGDSLYAIAFNFNADPRELAQWNGITSPYIIYPGQKILLSAPASYRRDGGSSAVQISTVKSPGQTSTRAITRPAETTTQATTQKPVPVKTSPPPATDSTSKASTSADPKSWKWPTNGPVLRAYVAGDPARNGLDIAGKEGQAVTATAAGQVVYSGNGLIGYGELIIIKHSENMLSAYAHNKVRLVNEGEQVSGGQKIAEMGRNPSGDQLLHFEIRARGKPVNPLNYLPKK